MYTLISEENNDSLSEMKIEGIPNKIQSVLLLFLALYVIALVALLCIGADKIALLGAKRFYLLFALLPLGLFYALYLFACAAFPSYSAYKENYRFLERFGYKYEGFKFIKEGKIVELHYSGEGLVRIFVAISIEEKLAIPYFFTDGHFVNIWEFFKFLGGEKYDEIDEFEDCMEILSEYMKSNSDDFAAMLNKFSASRLAYKD